MFSVDDWLKQNSSVESKGVSRARNLHHRWRVISRRKKMVLDYYGHLYYPYPGMLSKNKIHCSCWMCSGKRWAHGWSISDLKRWESGKEMEDIVE